MLHLPFPVYRFRLFPLLLLSLAVFQFTGCAFVETHRYVDAKADLQSSGNYRIAVATVDHRPEVLSGEFPADTTGIARGFFGNAALVTTASDLPLAEAMTDAIARTLREQGYEPVQVDLPVATPLDQADQELKQTGIDRTLLLVINEWRSSTWFRTSVRYDLAFEFARTGQDARSIGSVDLKGRESLGGAVWGWREQARWLVPRFFEKQLAEALNHRSARQILFE